MFAPFDDDEGDDDDPGSVSRSYAEHNDRMSGMRWAKIV